VLKPPPASKAENPLESVPAPFPVPWPTAFNTFPSELTNVPNVVYSAFVGICQPVGHIPCTFPVNAGLGEVVFVAPFWYCTASAHWYKPP